MCHKPGPPVRIRHKLLKKRNSDWTQDAPEQHHFSTQVQTAGMLVTCTTPKSWMKYSEVHAHQDVGHTVHTYSLSTSSSISLLKLRCETYTGHAVDLPGKHSHQIFISTQAAADTMHVDMFSPQPCHFTKQCCM